MAVKPATTDAEYTARLSSLGGVWWKRALDVQAPYRWNLRRLELGFTLDIGCGLGRNLKHLGGRGVGIDHNRASIEFARARGLDAYVPDEFELTKFNRPGSFDSLLLAHVVEHMTEQDAVGLLQRYERLLKPNGRVVLITPQQRGFDSDPTHVHFTDFEALRRIAKRCGLATLKQYSFPLPLVFGRVFKYNEFVSISVKP
ncbi:MAG: class I SAM-dependent methyltransferase [Acidobacteriota bacterium]